MNISKQRILILLLIAGNIVASDTDDDRLRERHQAPSELASILDQAYEHNLDFRICIDGYRDVCECPDDMACYIKKNEVMARIKGWQAGQQIINDKKLDEILLPQKYLWKDYLVAERLRPESKMLDGITKEQLKQIIVFAKKVRFRDFIGGRVLGTHNIFFTKDRPGKQFWKQDIASVEGHERKIAFIDSKFFNNPDSTGDADRLWQLFSKNKMKYCNYRTMAETDLDGFSRPHDFELFWQKYSECFQAHNSDQN